MSSSDVRLVVIGGSDAGISAAVRAKQVDPSADVSVLLMDDFPNYSVCGLPFYLSGEVDDWHKLAHRTMSELQAVGIKVLARHQAIAIDTSHKQVVALVHDGRESVLSYDRLVLATGARARRPVGVLDAEPPGTFCLRTVEDCMAIERHLRGEKPASVLIVGGGYIGVEMADALTRRGLSVTICGRGVLSTVDPSLSELVIEELRRHGVRVVRASVDGVSRTADRIRVSLSDGGHEKADMVLFATGVGPITELSQTAGVTLGESGAIAVTRAMETNVAGVYAAGDCAETWHRLLERPVYLPLGTTSHKQGRIAGENAVGGTAEYRGTLGTQVVKVFDLAVARTGLSEREADDAGHAPLTVEVGCPDRTAYYPGSLEMRLRLTGDAVSGRLLGAQIVADWRAQVAKRLDVFAVAIHHGMRVQELDQLDLSYTPPLSTPWDPVQVAAHAWMTGCRERAPE